MDSNHRPHPYQGCALPTELRARPRGLTPDQERKDYHDTNPIASCPSRSTGQSHLTIDASPGGRMAGCRVSACDRKACQCVKRAFTLDDIGFFEAPRQPDNPQPGREGRRIFQRQLPSLDQANSDSISSRLSAYCDRSRPMIELCIWLTRDSERSRAIPISFIVMFSK